MPTYKLTYFDLRGLGEPIRFLLSYMGEKFEDNRNQREQWPDMKKTTPFGKLPVLEIDGKAGCQSVAISRYLGKQAGLAGKNDWESLQIDMAIDTLKDFRIEMGKMSYEQDETRKETIKKTLMNETIPHYMGKFDAQIKENKGYLCNGSLSWGDLFFVAVLDTMIFSMQTDFVKEKYSNVQALKEKVLALPKIKAWVDKRPKTDR